MISGKMVDVLLHATLLVSLSSSMQLYACLFRVSTTSPFFLTHVLSHSNFIMLLPLFTAGDLSCKAETNGFAGTQRGRQLALPEVIWIRRDQ